MKIKSLLFALIVSLSLPVFSADRPASDAQTEFSGWQIETSVYPNPSNGRFHLNIKSDSYNTYQVKVVNLIGKTLVEKQVESNQEADFDLSAHPKGVYFLQIQLDERQIIKRIVIQ
ncbi:MAG: T9SS type A sorting domain-containing protein [Bacteroidia bacterium]|nr:T9SS type A sorting domain-containing protein [Bacteroidia bacterium]